MKNMKQWLKSIYDSELRTKVSVNIGNETIVQLPHTRDDITGLQFAVDVAIDTVNLEGQVIPVTLAESLIAKGKQINVDLYNHLWAKYAEVDQAIDPSSVVWEYDIEQVYTL